MSFSRPPGLHEEFGWGTVRGPSPHGGIRLEVNGQLYDGVSTAGDGLAHHEGHQVPFAFTDPASRRGPLVLGGAVKVRHHKPLPPPVIPPVSAYGYGTWMQTWATPGLSGVAPYFQRIQPFNPFRWVEWEGGGYGPDDGLEPLEPPQSIWHTGKGAKVGAFVVFDHARGQSLAWTDLVPVEGGQHRQRVTAILPQAFPPELLWQVTLPELYTLGSYPLEAQDGKIFFDPGDVFGPNPQRRLIVPGPVYDEAGADRVTVIDTDAGEVLFSQRLGYRLEQCAVGWDLIVKGWHVPEGYASGRPQTDRLIRGWRRFESYQAMWTLDPLAHAPIPRPVITPQVEGPGEPGRPPLLSDGSVVVAIAAHSALEDTVADKVIGYIAPQWLQLSGDTVWGRSDLPQPGPYSHHSRQASLTLVVKSPGGVEHSRTWVSTPAPIVDQEHVDYVLSSGALDSLGSAYGPNGAGGGISVYPVYTDMGLAPHHVATLGDYSYSWYEVDNDAGPTPVEYETGTVNYWCGRRLTVPWRLPMPGTAQYDGNGNVTRVVSYQSPDYQTLRGLGPALHPHSNEVDWAPLPFGIRVDSKDRIYIARVEPVQYIQGRNAAVFVANGFGTGGEPERTQVYLPGEGLYLDVPNPCAGAPKDRQLLFNRYMHGEVVATAKTFLECYDKTLATQYYSVDISERKVPDGIASTLQREVLLPVWYHGPLEPPEYDRTLTLRRLLDLSAVLEIRKFSDPAADVQTVDLVPSSVNPAEEYNVGTEESPDMRGRWGNPGIPTLRGGISPGNGAYPDRPWVVAWLENYDYKLDQARVWFTRVWWRNGKDEPPAVQQWDVRKDNNVPGAGFEQYLSESASVAFAPGGLPDPFDPSYETSWVYWMEPDFLIGEEDDHGGPWSGGGQHIRRQRLHPQNGPPE